MAFNGLSVDEAERLALLLEELGEAQQAIGKVLRHGYDSMSPRGGPTNRESLERELGDIRVVVTMIGDFGDVNEGAILEREQWKRTAIGQYLHHTKVKP